MRRALSIPSILALIACLGQARVSAVSIRDMVELSRAGLSDELLEAVLEADPTVFSLDAETILALREAGLSERIIVAMLRSGRQPDGRRGDTGADAAVGRPFAPPPAPMLVIIGGNGGRGGHGGNAGRQAEHADEGFRGFGAPVSGVSRSAEYVFVPYPVLAPAYDSHHVARRSGPDSPTLAGGGFGRFINDGFRRAVDTPATPAQPVYWGWSGQRRPGSWDPNASPR